MAPTLAPAPTWSGVRVNRYRIVELLIVCLYVVCCSKSLDGTSGNVLVELPGAADAEAEAQSLVARARAGDFGALEHVYRAYERSVYTLARRLTRTPEDAEDVLQETFLEVCRSLGKWRGDGSLWGWIRQVTASKALMRYRREKLRATEVLADDAAAGAGEDVPLRLDLEAALERLPERSRAVVWLHDVEGLTHEEIAELMGMTASFSKSQLARAHLKLRAWLGEEGAAR